MSVRINQYTGQRFVTTMPEIGNRNPHHTLFAGSLFLLATMTAWEQSGFCVSAIWAVLLFWQMRISATANRSLDDHWRWWILAG